MATTQDTVILSPCVILTSPYDKYFNCTVDWSFAGYTESGDQLIYNYMVNITSTVTFKHDIHFKTGLHQASAYVDDTVIDTDFAGSSAYLHTGETKVSFGSTFHLPAIADSGTNSGYSTNGVRFSISVDAKSDNAHPLDSFWFENYDFNDRIYQIPPRPSEIQTSTYYIDLANNILIKKYTTSANAGRCKSTISFSLGNFKEIIVSNYYGTNYIWNVPNTYLELLGGSNSKSATLTCATYYDDELVGTTSKIVTIAIPASSITVTNAKIGQNPTFAISKKSEDCYSTLTYDFGTLSGTIVENFDGTSYSEWTVPDQFYYSMKDTRTATCYITCTTYKNSELIGSSRTSFIVSVDETVCAPTINPTVVDIRTTTTNLTGSQDTIVKYESNVSYNANPKLYGGATISSCKITCGGSSLKETSGIITNPTSGTFVFTITDSRGFTVSRAVTKNFIEYLKPTCYVEAHATTDGTIEITVTGRIFNDSFGASANNITLKYNYKSNNDSNYGAWRDATPEYNGDKYSCQIVVRGLDYKDTFTVKAEIADSLNTYTSKEVTVGATSIFDWSANDFNFNVGVNINGNLTTDGLNIDGNASISGDVSATSLDVYRGASFGGNVEFKKDIAFRGDFTANNISASGTITAGGDVSSGGNLTVSNGNLTVSNTITGADLALSNSATIEGDVTIKGKLITPAHEGVINHVVEEYDITEHGWNWHYRRWNNGWAEAWGQTENYITVDSDGTSTICYFPCVYETYNYTMNVTPVVVSYHDSASPIYAMEYLRNSPSSSSTILIGPFKAEISTTIDVKLCVHLAGNLKEV